MTNFHLTTKAMKPLPKTADIVVVGAGIMGASIAYQLAKQSSAQILVLDERPPVGGISGRTFGQIRQHYSNELLVAMAQRGFAVIKNWDTEVGFGNPGYVQLGYLLLVTDNQLEALHRNINIGKACGVDTRFVTAPEIAALEPLLVTDGLAGGAYEPEGGYIDVTKMVLSWLIAAQAHGAEVVSGVRVDELCVSDGRVTSVVTNSGEVAAPLVIVATGAWACDLLDPIGVPVPVQRRRLELATLQTQPGQPQMHSCITDGNSNIVLRPDFGRRFVAAAYPKQMPLVADPLALGNETAQQAHLQRIDTALAERMPALRGATPVNQISGAYDVTPDYHPLIGWSSEVDGLCLALGFSGHGLKLSPAIGEMVAAIALG
ncbi:MAG: FAD-binding oxidoreductase, partial [Acidimicrobiia bacterium]|nr:FAD-binding oxidoreductase [Acidimicrobiia bacterium]